MQALSSLPSPNSDTSNSHALAVLSNEEEKMKSPVSRILQSNVTCHEQEDRRTILLLYPGGVALVHEEALAGGHVPLPDGGVRPARDHEGVLHRHAVDVAAVTPGMKQREANFLCNVAIVTCAMTEDLLEHPDALCLLGLGGPHPGGGVLAAGDEHGAVLGHAHAVDALLVVRHRLQQVALLPGRAAGPHGACLGGDCALVEFLNFETLLWLSLRRV